MKSLMNCSDEAFLTLVQAVVEYYDAREGGAWEMMFEDATNEDLLTDRVEVIRCLVALSEAMVS